MEEKDVIFYLDRVYALVTGALMDRGIISALAAHGCGQAYLEEGRNAHGIAAAAQATLLGERERLARADVEFSAARDAGRPLWDAVRDLAGRATGEHPETFAPLLRIQRLEDNFADWVVGARMVYETLLDDPDLLDDVAALGLAREDLEAGYDALLSVDALYRDREAAAARLSQVAGVRDDVLVALTRWTEPFCRALAAAIRDRPEIRTALGIDVGACQICPEIDT